MKPVVAWVAPYPPSYLAGRVALSRSRFHQPATWIHVLHRAIADVGAVDLHLLTVSRDVARDQVLCEGGVTYHFLWTPPGPARWPFSFGHDRIRLGRRLREIGAALVHAHGTEDAYALAAVSSGLPAIVSLQGIVAHLRRVGTATDLFGRLWAAATERGERSAIQQARAFVAKTRFAGDFIRSMNPSALVFEIPNPVHPAFFALPSPRPERPPGGSLLFVGWPTRAKGVPTLLEALARVAAVRPEVQLTIAGPAGGEYVREELLPHAARLGLTGRVDYRGALGSEAVARAMSEADLLVLPTESDQSPNVISEAMVAGLPVVASDVGGIPDLTLGGTFAKLVPPSNPEALARAVLSHLHDPAPLSSAAARAQPIARARHDPRAVAAAHLEAYEQILSLGGWYR